VQSFRRQPRAAERFLAAILTDCRLT